MLQQRDSFEVETYFIVKIHFQTAINGTAVPFMQKLALRPTASEATRSEKQILKSRRKADIHSDLVNFTKLGLFSCLQTTLTALVSDYIISFYLNSTEICQRKEY